MKIDRNITKTIEESKYLATENTWRYRSIIRIIYKKYEQMKYSVYKEEIFDALKTYEDFKDYSMDNLKSDLDQLVNWKNLTATADTAKVKSVEEFKNREFRYNLSPVTVEFERMIISLEHMSIENSSSLESLLVEKFRELIERMPSMLYEDEKKVYEWFKEVNQSFLQLNRNYQDYISKFYASKNDELMRTTEFLIYKEGFIKYLREFIKSLQVNSSAIKDIFSKVTKDNIDEIVNKLLFYERKIQSIDLNIVEGEFLELNKGRVNSMMEWFLAFNGREPLIEQLINNTNEIIRKITRYAAAIADKKSNNANRKEEYKSIANMFMKASNIEEAHEISALV
ncbi:MAG: TIGR02677 family protein, partial [Clostridium sp.]